MFLHSDENKALYINLLYFKIFLSNPYELIGKKPLKTCLKTPVVIPEEMNPGFYLEMNK